ncbi:Hypothetical protein, putative [Bodo saltans]|uniref:Uncharacterized protein n=1 Tax=Bodo saltans TaxID=75058 RepID=A0A0S4J1Q3_BODSA|nr:Hypothetical protein, putative [Bodo saltans]|eukprot:CUG48423.1 Hypothetical protein, putative [Bodo saltans]
MLCLPSQEVVDEENSSFLTVVSESEGDSSFPPRHVHSSQQHHHQHPTTVSNSSTLMNNNNNSSTAHPPPAMGKFAQIPLEESQEYAPVTAGPGTSRRSHPMMPSQRTSPTSDDDFGLSSTHPDALRTRTASTSHHLTHSVSMLRMSSHTFVSSNLPNLSFSHVAHNSSLSSQSGVHVIHHQSHEKERDVSPPAPVLRGLARPQRTEPRTRPLLFIAHPNELDDHIHRPPKAQPATNISQRSPTTTNTIGSPSLLLVSSRGADYDNNDRGFLVEVKAPTFSPEVMLTPREKKKFIDLRRRNPRRILPSDLQRQQTPSAPRHYCLPPHVELTMTTIMASSSR